MQNVISFIDWLILFTEYKKNFKILTLTYKFRKEYPDQLYNYSTADLLKGPKINIKNKQTRENLISQLKF